MNCLPTLPIVVALDVETTGLEPYNGDRIIEISLLEIDKDGTLIDRFCSLINPDREIPTEVCSINGITDDMVKNAPYFKDVAMKVFRFIENKTLLIHNADFDKEFLEAEFRRCGMDFPKVNGIIDTLLIARKNFNFPCNSLSKIASYYNINITGLHRAEADAMMAYKIYRKFCEGHCENKPQVKKI